MPVTKQEIIIKGSLCRATGVFLHALSFTRFPPSSASLDLQRRLRPCSSAVAAPKLKILTLIGLTTTPINPPPPRNVHPAPSLCYRHDHGHNTAPGIDSGTGARSDSSHKEDALEDVVDRATPGRALTPLATGRA
jgi:hypothetical protein